MFVFPPLTFSCVSLISVHKEHKSDILVLPPPSLFTALCLSSHPSLFPALCLSSRSSLFTASCFLPPPHLYWFVVGWSLSKGLLLCLNIMNTPRWFSNISEHKVSYGVADRKGRTSDRKELEGGGQAWGKKKVREGTEKHIWFMHTYSNETILV